MAVLKSAALPSSEAFQGNRAAHLTAVEHLEFAVAVAVRQVTRLRLVLGDQ